MLRTPFCELFDADVPILQLTPFTGQTAGLIHGVRPAGEIVRAMATEADRALEQALPARG